MMIGRAKAEAVAAILVNSVALYLSEVLDGLLSCPSPM